jgi:hypothetical protein
MSTHQGRAPATAHLLRTLLAEHQPYRRQWRRHVQRAAGSAVHQRAVAMVLAEYLWDCGEVEESDSQLPRRLKDPVARALSGRALSRRTLEWFIEAFEISEAHQRQLWDRLREDQELPPGAAPDLPADHGPVPSSHFRTRALDDRHVIGPDGLPREHLTVQVIEALEPLSRYTYRFDTNAASIEVLRGGLAGQVYDDPAPGVFAVDIHFPYELSPGETTTLEYRTIFRYQSPPPPEIRRGIGVPVPSVALEVEFHPDRLPARVWWAAWESVDGGPVSREPATLRADHSVHRFATGLEHTLIGFTWEWP